MNNLKTYLIMWSLLALLGGSLFGIIYGIHTVVGNDAPMYNCSIAEISPDFTPKMRDECRKLKAKQ
jgi:hypothetical protein